MYSGPGAGSLLAAATSWDGLSADLHSAAVSCSSAISGLTAQWLGPSSAAMAAAAAPYVTWLSTIAAQAEQVATQARAAVAAYETAFAMTVPPPVIAANRSLLMGLVATNFLGQNTPAIAATEAHYGEMWAQDAAAMYGYAGASATASTLTPLHPPAQVANPAAAAAPTGAALTGTETHAALSQLTAAIPHTLQGLASGTASGSVPADSSVSSLSSLSTLAMPARMAMMPLMMLSRLAMMGATGSAAGAKGASAVGPAAVAGLGEGLAAPASLGGLALGGGPAAAPVAASLGQAAPIGGLSVPASWSAAIPAAEPAAASAITGLPATAAGAAPGLSAGVPPLMPVANAAGRAVGETAPRLDVSPGVMARTPLGG